MIFFPNSDWNCIGSCQNSLNVWRRRLVLQRYLFLILKMQRQLPRFGLGYLAMALVVNVGESVGNDFSNIRQDLVGICSSAEPLKRRH